MEHKKLLRRFQWRLFGAALIRAVLWGLTVGGAAMFISALVWHILLTEPAPVWLWGSFAGGFPVGFLPCLILYFPTKKRTARLLDKTGLQERAGTMLAYLKKSGLMVELQRRDAAEHIKNTETAQLQPAFPVKSIICCLLSVVLCATMLLLPYDLLAPASAKDPETTAREEAVHNLIEDLRAQIREAQLSEELQKQLDAILEQLEKDLLATDNELEQAALIQQAQENIQESLFMSISRHAIGRALQQYTLTEELGIQIDGDDPTEIAEPMENMRKAVSGPNKQISRLSNNLRNAAENSGVDPGDPLYGAITNFAQLLDDLLNYTEGPDDTPLWTTEDLSFTFELAQQYIIAALEEQAVIEGEMENLDNNLAAGLNDLLSQQSGEIMLGEGESSQDGGSKGNNSSSPSGGSDGSSSGTPVGGLFDSGESNSTRTTMLEGIYDPISGDVTYGEVFAAYYAQYLEALDAGEIPDELRPYFERYFSSLS